MVKNVLKMGQNDCFSFQVSFKVLSQPLIKLKNKKCENVLM